MQADLLADDFRSIGQFDTVTALHVLDHIKEEQTARALTHLLAVTTRRLIIAVPYGTGEPAAASTHLQWFSRERLEAMGQWCLHQMQGAGRMWCEDMLGGFNEAGNLIDGSTFHLKRSQLIDLEASTRSSLLAQGTLDLPETVWPRFLLYLCDWGCATTSCLDAANGCIYLCRPSSTSYRTYTLRLEAPSLEAWLELWLEGNLQEKGQPLEDLTGSDDASDGAVVPFYLSGDPFEWNDEER